eukprot:CAMPEP_0198702236 /NCGR_PEP_ID=MMETSP1468-20131203/388643_1 /TAXON_ID=1461545 /ORGANISM="Mantoniella sp, Strain CCMP1436" /LENGTH=732 /DNA_ID=CAMNT_0044460743 /DNA_START=2655 /DNA_END=4853 /DNA_ORIENTATION=+
MNSALQQAAARFDKSETARAFFDCLDPKSTSETRKWLVSLRDKMFNTMFIAAAKSGETMDHSAVEIFGFHVADIVRAYSLVGTPEAAKRKCALSFLRFAAGRTGEVAFLTYERLTWDPHFKCIVAEFAQVKNVKTKKACFTAGVNRHMDAFLNLFDMLVLDPLRVHNPDSESPMWLFPELHRMDSCNDALGKYIRVVMSLDKQGNKPLTTLGHHAPSVPERASAAGIRVGCANEVFRSMPDGFATTTTGHSMAAQSAFYDYVRSLTSNCMPGATVMAGFPALRWGERGFGPVPADLQALVRLLDLNMDDFDNMIDKLLGFDSAANPKMHVGGGLRPAIEASFAMGVMYYPERMKAGEMGEVNRKLRDVVMKVGKYGGAEAAHQALCRWAPHLQGQFNQDNLHLTSRDSLEGMEAVVNGITAVGAQLSGLTAKVAEMQATLFKMEERQAQHMSMSAAQTAQHQQPATAAANQGTTVAEVATGTPQMAQAARELGTHAQTLAEAATTALAEVAAGSMGAPAAVSGYGIMRFDTTGPELTLKGMAAGTMYLESMRDNGGGNRLPNLEKNKSVHARIGEAKWCIRVFNGVALEEEKQKLMASGADMGELRSLVNALQLLVVQRFREAFQLRITGEGGAPGKDNKIKNMPNALKDVKGKPKVWLKVTQVSELNCLLKEAKKGGNSETGIDVSRLKEWRQAREQQRVARAPPALPEENMPPLKSPRRDEGASAGHRGM